MHFQRFTRCSAALPVAAAERHLAPSTTTPPKHIHITYRTLQLLSMDPFSSEGELLTIHNAFFSGKYKTAITTELTTLSPENAIAGRVYALRARIALGQAEEVITELDGETDTIDLTAVKVFAEYAAGATDEAVTAIEGLVETASDNATVQVLGAIVLQAEERSEEALELLGKHLGNLEAVALIVQIRLSQNRTDLALKEVQTAKRWAQDSLLVNLAESYLGLRIGGEKYQQAYYVFEELAQAASSSTSRTLVGQAVAELHLGRLEEAEFALQRALEKNPEDKEALANMVVLSTIAGKDGEEFRRRLKKVDSQHVFLMDLEAKAEIFDRAAGKYVAKVSA